MLAFIFLMISCSGETDRPDLKTQNKKVAAALSTQTVDTISNDSGAARADILGANVDGAPLIADQKSEIDMPSDDSATTASFNNVNDSTQITAPKIENITDTTATTTISPSDEPDSTEPTSTSTISDIDDIDPTILPATINETATDTSAGNATQTIEDPGPAVVAIDRIPDPVDFLDLTGVDPRIEVTSETVIVTGLEPNYSFSFRTNHESLLIDAGTDALTGTFSQVKSVTTSPEGTLVLAARRQSRVWNMKGTLQVAIDRNFTYCSPPDECFRIEWNVSTRPVDYTGVIEGDFGTVENANPGEYYVSNTVTISGLEPNFLFRIGAGSASTTPGIDIGTDALTGQFSLHWQNVKSSPDGTLRVALRTRAPYAEGTNLGEKTHRIQVVVTNDGDSETVEGSSFIVSLGNDD